MDVLSANQIVTEPLRYEDDHVHKVYEDIATHFSSTRYKPWPVVATFLKSLPLGSVGVDIGCGNGKYASVGNGIHMIASDRSSKLATIAAGRSSYDVLIADGLSLPHPNGRFDFAICIAVIHHFSTAERRISAIRASIDILAVTGRCLFFVWAVEQQTSRRGWNANRVQDVMVPWVTKEHSSVETLRTHLRYYHLYRRGELEDDIRAAGGHVVTSGYDRDNWWAIAHPGESKGNLSKTSRSRVGVVAKP